MKKSHAFRPHKVAPSINWPSFKGIPHLIGTTPDGRCSVYVDVSLGAPVLQNGSDLLADAPRIMAMDDQTFGVAGGHVDVIVWALNGPTDGTGGADHWACSFTDGSAIEVDASFGNSMRCSALLEAERSECQMGGNLCGLSTGEGLSRWCAMAVSNNALGDFATAPQWAADGMPDFVNNTDPTDGNPDANGCAVAFISWLMSLGKTLPAIAQQMVKNGDAGTLAVLYADLMGEVATQAWPKFQAAIAALPNGVTSDDPFGAMSQPAPVPVPTPTPTPTPQPGPGTSAAELAFMLIQAAAADWINGRDAATVKANAQSILDAN